MRRTTLQYTYIIGPVSEMCIILTFLVTRPIHISKAGLWQSAFVRGDAAIRRAGILKEQQLSGAVMHCWFVGLMLGSAWDMLILSVWERLECLGTVVNKICVWLCVHPRHFKVIKVYSHNQHPFREITSCPSSYRRVAWTSGAGRWVRAVHMCCCLPGGSLCKPNRSWLVSLWVCVPDIKLPDRVQHARPFETTCW